MDFFMAIIDDCSGFMGYILDYTDDYTGFIRYNGKGWTFLMDISWDTGNELVAVGRGAEVQEAVAPVEEPDNLYISIYM